MVRGLCTVLLALALLVAGAAFAAPIDPLARTVIDVRDRADLDRGETALFPVRIANTGDRAITYDLSVTGTDDWATWRVDPDAQFTVQPRAEAVRYVRLETDGNAIGGTRIITLVIKSGSSSTETPLRVYVRAPVDAMPGWIPAFQSVLLLLLLLLTLFAVSIAARRMRRRQPIAPASKTASDRAERVEIVDLDAARASVPNAVSTKAPTSRRRSVAVERASIDERNETHY